MFTLRPFSVFRTVEVWVCIPCSHTCLALLTPGATSGWADMHHDACLSDLLSCGHNTTEYCDKQGMAWHGMAADKGGWCHLCGTESFGTCNLGICLVVPAVDLDIHIHLCLTGTPPCQKGNHPFNYKPGKGEGFMQHWAREQHDAISGALVELFCFSFPTWIGSFLVLDHAAHSPERVSCCGNSLSSNWSARPVCLLLFMQPLKSEPPLHFELLQTAQRKPAHPMLLVRGPPSCKTRDNTGTSEHP